MDSRSRGAPWEPPSKWWTDAARLDELLGGVGISSGMSPCAGVVLHTTKMSTQEG